LKRLSDHAVCRPVATSAAVIDGDAGTISRRNMMFERSTIAEKVSL
jgi:hypothetical protein